MSEMTLFATGRETSHGNSGTDLTQPSAAVVRLYVSPVVRSSTCLANQRTISPLFGGEPRPYGGAHSARGKSFDQLFEQLDDVFAVHHTRGVDVSRVRLAEDLARQFGLEGDSVTRRDPFEVGLNGGEIESSLRLRRSCARCWADSRAAVPSCSEIRHDIDKFGDLNPLRLEVLDRKPGLGLQGVDGGVDRLASLVESCLRR